VAELATLPKECSDTGSAGLQACLEAIMAVERREIQWLKSFESALEQARVQKRHVLLDFSAAPM
jgi:hypothetical protein